MANRLPREAWVDREALIRPTVSAYVSNKNEIEGGVRVYIADQVDRDYWLIHLQIIAGVVLGHIIAWWLGI